MQRALESTHAATANGIDDADLYVSQPNRTDRLKGKKSTNQSFRQIVCFKAKSIDGAASAGSQFLLRLMRFKFHGDDEASSFASRLTNETRISYLQVATVSI